MFQVLRRTGQGFHDTDRQNRLLLSGGRFPICILRFKQLASGMQETVIEKQNIKNSLAKCQKINYRFGLFERFNAV
jgi:hypothetical protein